LKCINPTEAINILVRTICKFSLIKCIASYKNMYCFCLQKFKRNIEVMFSNPVPIHYVTLTSTLVLSNNILY
jgi:hypothetical protein